jgi:hypothetical protein
MYVTDLTATSCDNFIKNFSTINMGISLLRIVVIKGHVESYGRGFFVLRSIQVLKMGSFEKLGEHILAYRHKEHDQKWEKHTSNGDPCNAKACEQVNGLEYGA